MAIFARIVTGVTLASVLIASVAGSPSISTGSDVKARHAQHARRGVPARGRHAKRTQCAAKTTAADSATTAVSVASVSTTTTTTTKAGTPTTSKAATTITTSKAATTTTSGGGGSGSGTCNSNLKAGLAWTDISIDQKPFLDGACWCYNWGVGPCSKDGLENIPMLWGDKTISDWQSKVMGKSWGHILGMNEPNIASQSNISPQRAASMWKQYIEPVNAGAKGSPAVTTGSDGLQWMSDFFDACDGCNIDFINIHHYTISADTFKTYVTAFHTKWPQLPIWITEVGCMDYSGKGVTCTTDMANAMLDEVKAFVDSTSWVARWAWYLPAKTTNIDPSNLMMTSSGGINAFAKKYLGQS